jgi:RNA polymerase sigma-70 factor (ECF subfamily)
MGVFAARMVRPHGWGAMDDFEQRLAAAQTGDEAAFVDLFRSVQPTLLRYLATLGGPLAEDAAAETWVRVVRDLHQFRGDEAGWRSWVFTIGHARLRDAQRRAGREAIPVDADLEPALGPASDDVEASVEERQSTESALALIGRLPRDQAEAVLLRYVVGLEAPAAARVLGKRPGAVRVAAHRGLRRLAGMLAPQGVTDQTTPSVAEVT